MKKYIEALEIGESEESDFIKQEIDKDHSIDKIKKAKEIVKSKEIIGKKYKYRIHTCNHEEGLPCTTEEIWL